SLVVMVRSARVSLLTSLTDARATAAPDGSVTIPVILEVVAVCENALKGSNDKRSATTEMKRAVFITSSCERFCGTGERELQQSSGRIYPSRLTLPRRKTLNPKVPQVLL